MTGPHVRVLRGAPDDVELAAVVAVLTAAAAAKPMPPVPVRGLRTARARSVADRRARRSATRWVRSWRISPERGRTGR